MFGTGKTSVPSPVLDLLPTWLRANLAWPSHLDGPSQSTFHTHGVLSIDAADIAEPALRCYKNTIGNQVSHT